MAKHNKTAAELFLGVSDSGVLKLSQQAQKEARLRRRREWKEQHAKQPTQDPLPKVQIEKH